MIDREGYYYILYEQSRVVLGLLFEAHGIGAAGAGHTPPAEQASEGFTLSVFANPGHGHGELLLELFAGLTARGDHVVAMGHLAKQDTQVGGLQNLEMVVGGIVAQAADACGGVVEGKAPLQAELDDALATEAFLVCEDKVLWVGEMQEAHDAPEVVDIIRIEEVHRPACPWRWKTAKEEKAPVFRQEGLEGVRLDGHKRVD